MGFALLRMACARIMKSLLKVGSVLGMLLMASWGMAGLVVLLGLSMPVWLIGMILWVFAWKSRRAMTTWATLIFVVGLAVYVFGILKPRQDRDWAVPYERLPKVLIGESSETVSVVDLRDYRWPKSGEPEQRWTSATFDVSALDAVDLIIEPLADSNHFAHTMLSFRFGSEKRVIVSVEARREKGETFGLLPGLFRQFELMYQITTEEDSLMLRARESDSHLYIVPIKSDPAYRRELFVDMMRAARLLEKEPRFHHSLRSNCTTALFDHMNARLPEQVSYGKEVPFPAQAPALLDRLGWLADGLSWPRDKNAMQSAQRVIDHFGSADFSNKVREWGALR